jgi:hypothetical protein
MNRRTERSGVVVDLITDGRKAHTDLGQLGHTFAVVDAIRQRAEGTQ